MIKGLEKYQFCSRSCTAKYNAYKNPQRLKEMGAKGRSNELGKLKRIARLATYRTPEHQSKAIIAKNKKYWADPNYIKHMSDLACIRANNLNSGFGFKSMLKDPEYYDKHCRQSMLNATKRKSTEYDSRKAGKLILKSGWEVKFVKFLDDNPEVVVFEYEPFYLDYQWPDGSIHKYYPDFLILYRNNHQEVVEIKPAFLLNDPVVVSKLNSLRLYCEDKNMGLSIVSEVN
jgi:hypothetical protein